MAATGAFQRPVIPPVVPDGAVPAQIHSSAYRNPEQLPEGAVLVVGAGSSGSRSPTNCAGPAAGSSSRSARTTVRPARTGDATSAGGSASSASGTRRRLPRAPNTSPSRSAARAAATRWTSGTSRPPASNSSA
ncbi:hypothetical protein O1L60_36110 [Streptomyces diastatochromogenes]|nr:hypothetical protein [Streptomyces diastatochromogenes]